jgi:hypothetical protein
VAVPKVTQKIDLTAIETKHGEWNIFDRDMLEDLFSSLSPRRQPQGGVADRSLK